MPEVEVYFTEEFLTYLAASYGTMASKIYLLADDSEVVITEDIAALPTEIQLVKKTEANVTTTIDKNTFECTAKIKKFDHKKKSKSILLTGTFTELIWGTNPSGDLIEHGPDYTLFVKENPTEELTKEIFSRVFNSSTDYNIHVFRGSPLLQTDSHGLDSYSYWSSESDFFSMTIPDLFPLYSGSHIDGTSVIPPTISGAMSYPGFITTGTSSTLTSFMYQSETGLMLGTFSDLQIAATSTESIDGFFITNDKLKIKKTSLGIEISEDIPLILFGCRIAGGLSFGHEPGLNEMKQLNYTVMSTPRISLSMDVVII